MTNYYAVLGVAPGRDTEHIRHAYMALAKMLHPDTARPGEDVPAVTIEQVNEAYYVLKDSKRRALYDMQRQLLLPLCLSCKGDGLVPRYRGFFKTGMTTCPACSGTGVRRAA